MVLRGIMGMGAGTRGGEAWNEVSWLFEMGIFVLVLQGWEKLLVKFSVDFTVLH